VTSGKRHIPYVERSAGFEHAIHLAKNGVFLPIATQEMVMAGWFIVKGFNLPTRSAGAG